MFFIERKKLWIYVSSAVIFIIIVLLVTFFLSRSNSLQKLYINNSALSTKITPIPDMAGKLESTGVIDKKNVKTVQVVIVDNINDPMFVQSNQNGTVIISSRFDIDKTNSDVKVYVDPEKYILDLDEAKQLDWINSEVYKNLNIVYKGNKQSDVNDLEQINFFKLR